MNHTMWTSFWALACVTVLLAVLILAGAMTSADEPDQPDRTRDETHSSADVSHGADQEVAKPSSNTPLAGTDWRLVYFQSMDDAIGTVRPDDRSRYTMRLRNRDIVTMRLSCNRASGTWAAKPSGNGSSGRFDFGSLAVTRASCPSPSMDARIAAHAKYSRWAAGRVVMSPPRF